MSIDWNRETDPDEAARLVQIVTTERVGGQGTATTESLESPTGKVARSERLRRLQEELGRRSRDAPGAEKPDPDVAVEVVKGAESGLAKAENNDPRMTMRERVGLEAVVLTDGTRPSLTVKDGFVDLADATVGQWDLPLGMFRDAIRRVIAAVGRINIPLQPGFAGTGFVIAPGLMATNRHVLEEIATQDGNGKWTLKWPNETTIDFIGEDGAAQSTKFPVTGVAFAGPDPIEKQIRFRRLDVAVLNVDAGAQRFPTAVKLEQDAGAIGASRDLYVVGFPGRPHTYYGTNAAPPARYETTEVMNSVFKWKFGVKKLAPGRVEVGPGTLANDSNAWVFSHDSSTLAGNSGSAVVDLGLDGSRVIGIHFGGLTREENWAHAFAKVRDSLLALNPTWV
jgi:hypothetical protein